MHGVSQATALTDLRCCVASWLNSALWIVMELLEGGSMQELMRETDSVIDEATIAWIMKDLLQVMTQLLEISQSLLLYMMMLRFRNV
jgi:serine/threonine protein kinase